MLTKLVVSPQGLALDRSIHCALVGVPLRKVDSAIYDGADALQSRNI